MLAIIELTTACVARQDEVARLQAAGASVLAEYAGHHVTMADPEGNEFDVT